MAYVAVESDDRTEEGQGLEFKSFLGDESAAASQNAPSGGRGQGANLNRGYLSDASQTKGSASFWTPEYYQSYFDVDTKTVLSRCITTLNPFSPSYTSAHLTPYPDLYGPFWTLTTLIFALFVTSSLAASIVSYLSDPGTEYDYDFTLLSVAVGLVYAYGLGVPIMLWAALKWWVGLGTMGEGWGVVEAVSVWGYGMFVWIPVSVLCVIPVPLVRWVLTGIAFAVSGYYLVKNVYPVLASADQKPVRLLIIIVAVLHAGVALTFKVLFFSYYVVKEIGVKDPIGDGDTPVRF
ncbi:Yip1-domain-containing protein [Dentipellis sp. KUC8613]|nr:Yip1-domain-containing protein [Dentipellis sp. KUC8613]